MLFALIIAVSGTFSVPQLSHDSVTHLVQHYFKDNPPTVIVGDVPSKPELVDALVASRLFAAYDLPGSCGEHRKEVHLTPHGSDVALERGWRVRTRGYSVTIPLGSFSLVTESLTYSKQSGLPGSIHFAYWFKPNGNVPYLLAIAPAYAWGSVGMDEGSGVGLDKANRVVRGTLPIRWWDGGWVIQGPYQRPPPIC
jgi:hypothetical protein